jgi:hypothetical protein
VIFVRSASHDEIRIQMTEAGEGGSNAANPPPWLQLILKANYFQTAIRLFHDIG